MNKNVLVVVTIIVALVLLFCLICGAFLFISFRNNMNNSDNMQNNQINSDQTQNNVDSDVTQNNANSEGMGISFDQAVGSLQNDISFVETNDQQGMESNMGVSESGLIITTVGSKTDLVQISVSVVPDPTNPNSFSEWQNVYGSVLDNVFGANAASVESWMESNNNTVAGNTETYVSTEIDGKLVKYGIFTITSGQKSIRLVIEKPGVNLFY